MKRQLVAILYADVAGYTRLTGDNEDETHRRLSDGLDVLTWNIETRNGKKLHEAGDAILAEFPSVQDAVEAAIASQQSMDVQNENLDAKNRLEFRIGINVGEVIHDRGDIYGDDVNITARIQELAQPGSIACSVTVREQLRLEESYEFEDLGFQRFKNVNQSVHVYVIRNARAPDEHPISQLKIDRLKGQPLFDFGHSQLEPVTTGGCLCGNVTYEVLSQALGAGMCYCRLCQLSVGAVVNAWVAFPKESVRFTNSLPTYFATSPIATRGFCSTCGTSITYALDKPTPSEYIVLTTASLDDPENYPPTWHGGMESKMPWFDMHDELPRTRSDESPVLKQAWGSVGLEDPAGWNPLPNGPARKGLE